MCGIGGWLGALPDADDCALRMMVALRHRGPDAQGSRSWPRATLVHTRLSIIDTSSAGSQPMSNEDGTVWTVFNGEIYNHRDLRRDLESRGHRFKGRSDGEILPHLYEEYGSAFVTKLRGMFALAIYDSRTRTLLLFRDRFGIKPLFYTAGRDRLAFASEINALLQLPDIDDRPDRQAVYDLTALFYIPAPATFYASIRAVQPGEMLSARLDFDTVSWKSEIYHRWVIAPDATLTLDRAVEQAESLITTAVRRQLESDVPLGALLSGGIDSSLISNAAQAAVNGSLATFNVRFAERAYDETWAAVTVAKHIGSKHQVLDMDDQGGTWDYITGLLLHAGQPFADTSLFAFNTICRLMRQHVAVALSGDGGDEGFGGYNFYWWISWIANWQRLPSSMQYGACRALTPLSRLGVVPPRLPQRLADVAGVDPTTSLQNLFCWVREREQKNLCHDTDLESTSRLFEPQWEHRAPPAASKAEQLSMRATEVNIRLMLPNDFLFKADTASMKEALEVRVPMLDEDLFSFGLSLPQHLKVKGRTCKRVLRALAQRNLPTAVAEKPKLGFSIPVDTWVNEDYKRQLKDALLGPTSHLPEFFRPEVYRPMVEAFCGGDTRPDISREGLYQRVIMLHGVHATLARRSLTAAHQASPVGAAAREDIEAARSRQEPSSVLD